MKKFLLSFTMILSVMALSAQGYTVTNSASGDVVESGVTYHVYGPGNDWGELNIGFTVTANENVRLFGEKVENNVIEGTSNFYCFGLCFGPSVYVNPEPVAFAAGDEQEFSMHFMADDILTVLGQEQSMTYYLYPADDPDNKFVINVIFMYSMEGMDDISAVEEFGNAYPVPASDVVNFDYSFNSNVSSAMIAVYNMMGQEVLRNDISGMSGKLSLNVSGLADGVYFYSLIVNGNKEKSSKLVVRR